MEASEFGPRRPAASEASDAEGPSFTLATLSSDPGAVARQISAWASADAVRRLTSLGVRSIQPNTHALLVDAVLQLAWPESESLSAAVLDFALELVSAVPAFNKPVIDALVITWLPTSASRDQQKEAASVADATLLHVHETLRGILRVTPLALSNLFHAVKEQLPHRRHELSVHVGFLQQLLQMLGYCHPLRARVVHLLVERLVDLDVQIAQQLKALEEAADADETIFEVESDTSAEELAKMRLNAEKLDKLLSMIMELVRTTCTQRTLSGSAAATTKSPEQTGAADGEGTPPPPVQSSNSPFRKGAAALLGGSTGELELLLPPSAAGSGSRSGSHDALPMMSDGADVADLRTLTPGKVARTASAGALTDASPGSCSVLEPPDDPAEALFEALIGAFRASVLPTYKCRCVQFLVFYVCSFDDAFSRSFLQLLLAQMRSEHVHAEARLACASYIASFLARAKFVSIDLVLATTREMVRWGADYQSQAIARLGGAPPSLDVNLHGTFYAAMQGVLYICCYRHEQLQTAEAGGALSGLAVALAQVLHGPLNPLKFCLEAIAIEFERLGVCDIIELAADNERLMIASRTANGAPNVLDDFFPFDPLHGFRQSEAIVAPLYQEWIHRSGGGNSEPRDSNLSAISRSEDASESLATSLHGMSVTPCSGEDPAMGDHMRRRLAENRSLISGLVGSGGSPFASPLVQPNGAAPKIPGFGL